MAPDAGDTASGRSGAPFELRSYDVVKRAIDVLVSLLLLIVLAPLIALIIVAIKLTSKGPILADTPKRVGRNGKLFYAYKFRSDLVEPYYLLETASRFRKADEEQQGDGNHKVRNDPKTTRVGRLLRKHSLDEIPQLVNVLKGEMSLVGPRPCHPAELRRQQRRYPGTELLVKEMLAVRPGITGTWQVSGRSQVDFPERVQMEAGYARSQSFLLDTAVLLKTPRVMITGKGAG